MDEPPSKNIKTLDQTDFNWADGQRALSLKTFHDATLKKVDDSTRWYQSKRVLKRQLAWCFRVAAIILGAVATAMPTLSEMTHKTDDWYVRPGLATIIGIVVAALLILDKFIGASSAWIRFTMAETALKELRDELSLAWMLETATWAESKPPAEPTVEQTKHALTTLQTFVLRANQIVHDETNQWKTEFQGALQQIDDSAKTPPRKIEEAVGIVKITNPDRLAGDWSLSIDGGPEERAAGDSKSIRRTPGPITVKVSATIKVGANGPQTKQFTMETADILVAGTPKTITIPLPLT